MFASRPTRTLRRSDRRVLAGLLAAAIVLTAMVGTGAQAADDSTEVVYIARGFDFPDALVGAVIAAMEGAPILTVRGPADGDSIPAETAAELTRLKPNEIVVFGGLAVVSQNVENQLGAFTDPPGNTRRLAGDNRFATAVEISQALPDMVKRAEHAVKAQTADNALKLDGKTADEFAQPETVTGHWACPGRAFYPAFGEDYGSMSDGLRVNQSGAGAFYECPVFLPHGAAIASVVFTLRDSDAGASQHIGECKLTTDSLDVADATDPQLDLMAATPADTGTPGTFALPLEPEDGADLVVDNSDTVYRLVCLISGTSLNVGIYGATVTYQIVDVPTATP